MDYCIRCRMSLKHYNNYPWCSQFCEDEGRKEN